MIYDIHNPTKGKRIIYDGAGETLREISIPAGETKYAIELSQPVVDMLAERVNDLVLTENPNGATEPVLEAPKPPLHFIGMWGVGDNIKQRAVLRELMKTNDVWLQTHNAAMYGDLAQRGLKVINGGRNPRIREQTMAYAKAAAPPAGVRTIRMTYNAPEIARWGSILAAQFACAGLPMPAQPDFSMPIPPAWREKLLALMAGWKMNGKPLMVYRPVILNSVWRCDSRSPDPAAYATLYQSICDKFFVVSIADLKPGQEWIVGTPQDVDVELNHGELDFETMAALFAEANLAFCNAGFSTVLAQAVGTPSITVYGGHESSKTTNVVGAHLAPSLFIEPNNPCDCHSFNHACDKRIDVPKATNAISNFIEGTRGILQPRSSVAFPPSWPELKTDSKRLNLSQTESKTLVFCTTYISTDVLAKLTEHWIAVHTKLNPDCDFLIVDSRSPKLGQVKGIDDFTPYVPKMAAKKMFYAFPDNIGHLGGAGHASWGKDGWGRAFSFGLNAAIAGGYDYAFHIEGDSLFRLPVKPIIEQMRSENIMVASIPVNGTKFPSTNKGWTETGLMAFNLNFVEGSAFVARYGWERRTPTPSPEVVIAKLLGSNLRMMPWKGMRGDKDQITKENVLELDLDWITHCRNDALAYDVYAENVLSGEPAKIAVQPSTTVEQPSKSDAQPRQEPTKVRRLNLGCGSNKLVGWENHDADIDISKRLPFDDQVFSHILCEHCVEHIDYFAAVAFFRECHRVLRPGGTVRIAVPSIEQIRKSGNQAYYKFTTKFHDQGATARGAMFNILYKHGHKAAWTASLLEASLDFAGFENVVACKPGESSHAELRGVEGHHKIITKEWNDIETCVAEGTAVKAVAFVPAAPAKAPATAANDKVAIIVGGSETVWIEVEQAKLLCYQTGKVPVFFIINDMIARFPEDGVGISLHPESIKEWLDARKMRGFPTLKQVWSNNPDRHHYFTNTAHDWGGSGGLFAAGPVAMKSLGFRKIMLCGVPMTVMGKHFVRHAPWGACSAFQKCWNSHLAEMKPFVRSFSGWTAEQLGKPDEAFLKGA